MALEQLLTSVGLGGMRSAVAVAVSTQGHDELVNT